MRWQKKFDLKKAEQRREQAQEQARERDRKEAHHRGN